MPITALFTKAKMWNQPKYPVTSEFKKCGIYAYQNIIHSLKELKPNNMDDTEGHFVR